MHTFLTLIEARTIYVDVPDHDPSHPFPGWDHYCRIACVEQGLLTEEEAEAAHFHPAARPPKPKAVWRS